MTEALLKASDVARILNVSKSFSYLLIKRGQLPSIRMGKARRVRPIDLEEFIAKNIVIDSGDTLVSDLAGFVTNKSKIG